MEQEGYLKIRFALGLTTLFVGFLAANLALFHWIEETGFYYLLGEYARYICAYGGFAAMIFGAILINDFLTFRNLTANKSVTTLLKKEDAYQKAPDQQECLMVEDPKKSSMANHEIEKLLELEKEKEKIVVAQTT